MNTATLTKRPAWRMERYAPALLLAAALAIYIAIALSLGLTRFLTPEAAISILNRSIALGITAVGQTFAILVGRFRFDARRLGRALLLALAIVVTAIGTATAPVLDSRETRSPGSTAGAGLPGG